MCVCVWVGGCTCMHTELNEHSHFYVLSSSKLLAVKTEHDPKLKVSTPFAQVCACLLCLVQNKKKLHNAYNNPGEKGCILSLYDQ